MNREIHVRFWESAGVRFPCATQPFCLFSCSTAIQQRAKARELNSARVAR
jgi:hypothetical protein